MFWNVTFIYDAFIRTTDHCKVQTAPLGHLTIFLRIFTIFFLILENALKFANFFCWGNEFSIYDLNITGHVTPDVLQTFKVSGSRSRSQRHVTPVKIYLNQIINNSIAHCWIALKVDMIVRCRSPKPQNFENKLQIQDGGRPSPEFSTFKWL